MAIHTGVASGKSLCYQLPLLNQLLNDAHTKALLLFPTKALAQDQLKSLQKMIDAIDQLKKPLFDVAQVYDGDTPTSQRKKIREEANFIFSNPDMLHLGVLPYHTKWENFFRNLKYIIIDEVHIYRGVFGSHFSNLFRRFFRICKFYKSNPQIIVTSATIANTKNFVEKLLERDFAIVDKDSAPKNERHFIIYNPPIVNQDLGIRRSSIHETVAVADYFRNHKFQSLIFSQSRKSVELIVSYLQKKNEEDEVCGYRSGYLPTDRRNIERKLRNGKISTIVSTNALELGIDIGSLDVVVINGYPGSISSTLQQAGRAGRKTKASLTVMVMSANLLDQFLVNNPKFLLSSNPEQALLNPDNPFILLQHIKCAVYEKPFLDTENFGFLDENNLKKYLILLQKKRVVIKSREKYYWNSKKYPAEEISFRGIGLNNFSLICNDEVIGIVDNNSAFWFAHPQAIYLHNGKSYLVQKFDLENKEILLNEKNTDYYTQSNREMEFELLEKYRQEKASNHSSNYGFLKVISRVISYTKKKYHTHEILDHGEVDLPEVDFVTTGFWISFSQELIHVLKNENNWNNEKNDYGKEWKDISKLIRQRDNHTCQVCGKKDKNLDVHHKKPFKSFLHKEEANQPDNLISLCKSCHRKAESQVYIQSGLAGMSYLLRSLAPVYLMCDRDDIQVSIDEKSKLANGEPVLIFYDSAPGGVGLSKKIFEVKNRLIKHGIEIIEKCNCKTGCPACVGPVAESGIGAKKKTLEILKQVVR